MVYDPFRAREDAWRPMEVMPVSPGSWISLLPITVLLASVIATKRSLESMVAAIAVGFMLTDGLAFFPSMLETISRVMQDPTIGFVILLCSSMGALVAVLDRSGGTKGFGDWVASRVSTRRGVLLATWVMSLFIFIDDFLISLTLGTCMTPSADRFKVPREMTAYVVNSSAAPVASLVPISAWAVFIAALLEKQMGLPAGRGLALFVRSIPFNFYAWFAFFTVPLVVTGIIPAFGPMKRAEERVRNTGVLAPPGSDLIAMRKPSDAAEEGPRARTRNLVLPLLVLIAATMAFGVNLYKGAFTALFFCGIYYRAQGVMAVSRFTETCLKGVGNMVFPIVFTCLAFTFNQVNSELGLIPFIIGKATPLLSPALFPLVIFVILGFVAFLVGISWSLYLIAFPLVIPLAQALGADLVLAVAATVAAGTMGQHCCFYSDGTILVSASTGCDNIRHALSQFPYAMMAAGLAGIAFLIAGVLSA